MDSNFIHSIIAVSGTLGGALIGAITTISIQHYSEKKSRRELIYKAAIKEWERIIELAKEEAEITKSRKSVLPLDSYLLHHVNILNLLMKRNINEKKVQEALEKSKRIVEVYKKNSS